MEEPKPDNLHRVSVSSRRDLDAPLAEQDSRYDWRNMTRRQRRSLILTALLALPVLALTIWALTRVQ